ncbi:MAG: hypothetical protein RIE52_02495 [Balneola sp.]|jgi:hypothetical protein
MFKKIYFSLFIFVIVCSCNSSDQVDYEFKLTLEKQFASTSQLFLSPQGNYEPDLLTFEVNDSIISPSVNQSGEMYYSANLDGFPGIGDSVPEKAKISYNGKESLVVFTVENCSPRKYAGNVFYVNPTDDDQFLLRWRICDQAKSDFENLILNTDYSLVELSTRHLDVNNNFEEIRSIDTSFVSLTDSLFVDKDFYPRRITSDTEDILVQTSIRITNVQGPLPEQKDYLEGQKLPILFYDKTSILGSIQVQN